jgi:hypothetical protein
MNLCKKPDESIQVASAVLSQKYEERLFHGNGQGRGTANADVFTRAVQ